MSIAKHTPGLWSYAHRKDHHGMYNTEVFCEAGATIATLSWYPMPTTPQGVTGTYREGNASLIAAAPDLMDALEGAYSLAIGHAAAYQFNHQLAEPHPTHKAILDRAVAALAKAKGEPA